MTRRTKIVATIGPASESDEVLVRLVEAGMDVARLSMAHGDVDSALRKMERVRSTAERVGRAIGVLADLPGPKVRLGSTPAGGLELLDGDRVTLSAGEGPCEAGRLRVDYDRIAQDVRPGDRLTIGDGGAMLVVDSVVAGELVCVVSGDALLRGRPGLHVSSERLTMTSPTPADLTALDALVAAGVDMVALSFVRSAHDVRRVGTEPHPRGPLVVAKIETRSAVENLGGIIEASGAIMVARGDLGIECGIEELPHLQKRIIRECIALGRPVITATQMLESMITHPGPTRAEVTDVANAIFDGTSAVMLSAETAVGDDPVNVVRTMDRIAGRADAEFDYDRWPRRLRDLRLSSGAADTVEIRITDAVSGATWRAATELGAAAIVCLSDSGFTVRSVARFRPAMRIIGMSTSPRTVSQLCLSWGVTPTLVPPAPDRDASVEHLASMARERGLVQSGDMLAVAWGSGGGTRRTDSLRLVRVP